jgi:uncharacterized membrane protein required for colicin V production
MTSIIATLAVLAILVLSALAGFRDGIFFTVYALLRNLFGFLCAMTFCEPLARVAESLTTRTHPAHEYFVMISFAAILAVVYLVGRSLKVKYTVPQIYCPALVDKIVGPPLGLANAIVVTGSLLILCSLAPFAKYIPGNLGDAHVKLSALDTGAAMLRFYNHETGCMPGKAVFLLDDEPLVTDETGDLRADGEDKYKDLNNNGHWDRGQLWKYYHYMDILPQDLQSVPGYAPPPES